MRTRGTPDALALDRMVLGTDDPADAGDRAAWIDLLAAPDAHRAWQRAVDRRAESDRFAAVVIDHSWLAAPLLSARRAMRRAVDRLSWPGAEARTTGSLLAATLGADPPDATTVAIAPGDHRVLALGLGATLHFDLPPGTVLRVQTPSGLHDLGAGVVAWRLDEGDAPVALALVRTLDDAPMAMVILIEEAPSAGHP